MITVSLVGLWWLILAVGALWSIESKVERIEEAAKAIQRAAESKGKP